MLRWLKCGRKGQHPKNVSSTLRWVQIFASLCCLGIFEFPHGNQRRYLTVFHVVLSMAIFFTCFYAGYIKHDIFNAAGIEFVIFAAVNYINIVIAVVCVVTCLYNYTAMRASQMKIDDIDMTLNSLGISRTYHDEVMTNIRLTVIVIIVDLILYAVTSYLFLFNLGALNAIYVNAILNYPFQINLTFDLIFITNISIISTRLQKMNSFIRDMIKTVTEPEKTWKIGNETKSRVATIKIINPDKIRSKFITTSVQTVRQAHQELCDIARQFNEQLSIQVTLEMAGCFGLFTGLLYNLYIAIVSPHDSIAVQLNNAISLGLWSLVYIGKVFFVNRSCAIAVSEATKTGEIIHELDSPIVSDDLRTEVHQFALQLIQNPLVFTGCGFFSLDYSLVQGFIGSVTTYLVILIQMSHISSKSNMANSSLGIYANLTGL